MHCVTYGTMCHIYPAGPNTTTVPQLSNADAYAMLRDLLLRRQATFLHGEMEQYAVLSEQCEQYEALRAARLKELVAGTECEGWV